MNNAPLANKVSEFEVLRSRIPKSIRAELSRIFMVFIKHPWLKKPSPVR